jgi:glycosyltransferase involved in cell wall biosynthesis
MDCKVSVIVPVYNGNAFLRRCMDSISSQTYKNLEIICIDDGSTDNSLSILHEYEAVDSRISIIRFDKNKGVSAARNAGMRKASGEYVAFVDNDDYLALDNIEVLLERATEVDADITHAFFVKIVGGVEFHGYGENAMYVQFVGTELSGKELGERVSYLPGYIWNALYKKSFLDECGIFFDESLSMYEDLLWTIKIHTFARKITATKFEGYYYCWRPESACSCSSLSKCFSIVRTLSKVDKFFRDTECILQKASWRKRKYGILARILKYEIKFAFKVPFVVKCASAGNNIFKMLKMAFF